MVQDENGNWFYFYWGPTSEDEEEANVRKLSMGVKNGAYYVPCGEDISQFKLHTTKGVVSAMENM